MSLGDNLYKYAMHYRTLLHSSGYGGKSATLADSLDAKCSHLLISKKNKVKQAQTQNMENKRSNRTDGYC